MVSARASPLARSRLQLPQRISFSMAPLTVAPPPDSFLAPLIRAREQRLRPWSGAGTPGQWGRLQPPPPASSKSIEVVMIHWPIYLALCVGSGFAMFKIHRRLLFGAVSKQTAVDKEKVSKREMKLAALLVPIHATFIVTLFNAAYTWSGMTVLGVDKHGILLSAFASFLYILTDSQLFPLVPVVKQKSNKRSRYISDRVAKMVSLPLMFFGVLLQIIDKAF